MSEMSREEMLAQIAALTATNAKLIAKVATRQKISFKVTDKGGLSVYGLGRFPVTLYRSQWHALLAALPALREFMSDNDHLLVTKD